MVNVKVPESMVDQVAPGQKVRIDVDAFPGQTFDGVVAKAGPAARPSEPVRVRAASPKVYSTLIKVDQSFGNFRPGMTAGPRSWFPSAIGCWPYRPRPLKYDGKDHLP